MLRFIPNALCILRMLLAVPVAVLLSRHEYTATFGVLAVAAVTDGLDGFIAKRFGWTSEAGKILDPLADKILLVTTFLTLALIGLVPLWVTAIAVMRDIVISAGAIAYRLIYGPIHGHPTILSKFNTLCQIVYLLSTIAAANGARVAAALLQVLGYVVVVTTVASGAQYVSNYSRRALEKSRAIGNTSL